MRHLGSLLLSLVLTVVWYALIGLGGVYYLHDPGSLTHKLALAGALVGAGLLYGLLLLLRLSPLGLVIAGLLLLVVGAWTLLADAGSKGPFEYLPTDLFGQKGALVYPVEYTVFAAVPMLMTVVSPRRWRRYANPQPVAGAYSPTPPVPVPTSAPDGGYPPPGGYGVPAGGYGTPADPYGTPVSPAGPEGTRVMPAAGTPSSGGPSYATPSSGAGGYPPPSSGAGSYATPSSSGGYPPPSGGSYAAPSSGSGYPAPSAYPATPASPAGPAPVWPAGPGVGRDDPDATRPI